MVANYLRIPDGINLCVAELGHKPTGLSIIFQVAPEKVEPGSVGKKAGDILFIKNNSESNSLIVSLGTQDKLTNESFRLAGAGAARWLIQHQAEKADLDLDPISAFHIKGSLSALLEGLLLGAYRFDTYKQHDDPITEPKIFLRSNHPDAIFSELDRAHALIRAVNLARSWGHEPANVINPITLAERALALAANYGMKCTVLDETALKNMGAGAITAVGKGSQTPSRLIILEYPGHPDHPDTKPVVLVGKALTFDSGGYSLKGVENIVGMKYDKCGGLTVLATMQAAVELGIKTPLIGIVAAAENMVSAQAYRPDDILVTLSGKTVEIISTDAEGRLVLADALTYAQRNFPAQSVIDLATLTGGVVTALGRVRAGLMSNDDSLAERLYAAGEITQEKVWRLPMDDEYAKSIQGDDADIKNSGGREGHAILGGMFLKAFIEDGTAWAHLDIAGVADTPKETPYSPKGATGFGVRLLINYLESL